MPISALDYLMTPASHAAPPVCALYGDDAFLIHQSLAALRAQVFGSEDDGLSLRVFDGGNLAWATLIDELSTQALFGPDRRMVVVEAGDGFVSEHRQRLEAYCQKPRAKSVLVLVVGTWPANTRLAKIVASSGLPIECKTPPPGKLAGWLVRWCKQTCKKKLDREAADQMIELVGPELGLLNQELGKLANLAGERDTITPGMVAEAVGSWKARTAWEMIDATFAGDAPQALSHLDRLLAANESPVALLAQMAYTLRRLAAASRMFVEAEAAGRRRSLREVLAAVGVKFAVDKAERQLKHLGRVRGLALPQWLVQADLDLKGDSALPPRVVIEQLLLRLAEPAKRPG